MHSRCSSLHIPRAPELCRREQLAGTRDKGAARRSLAPLDFASSFLKLTCSPQRTSYLKPEHYAGHEQLRRRPGRHTASSAAGILAALAEPCILAPSAAARQIFSKLRNRASLLLSLAKSPSLKTGSALSRSVFLFLLSGSTRYLFFDLFTGPTSIFPQNILSNIMLTV